MLPRAPFQERLEGIFIVPYFSAIAAAREYCPFYGCNPMLVSQLRYRVHLAFCEFTLNLNIACGIWGFHGDDCEECLHGATSQKAAFLNIVVSFYHTMAVKSCLEDNEIERHLKCKICDVGLWFLGCFKEYYTKTRFSYMMQGLKSVYMSSR
jgi:hypothetical protein